MSYSRESIKIKENELRCLIRSGGSDTKDGPDIISIRGLEADRHFALTRHKLRRDDITDIHELLFLIGAEVRFCVIGNLLAFDQIGRASCRERLSRWVVGVTFVR